MHWGCLETDVSVPAIWGDYLRCTAVDTGKVLPEKSGACRAVTGSLQWPSLVLENENMGISTILNQTK